MGRRSEVLICISLPAGWFMQLRHPLAKGQLDDFISYVGGTTDNAVAAAVLVLDDSFPPRPEGLRIGVAGDVGARFPTP
ncbi:hypothetical protein ACUXZZ_44070 [Streptomyces graminifolii]|uniref:hypothetical protein n=1 Tax=Streptomyces graminifolii TaxID=1266771 RepID=UPI00405960AD